MSGMKSKTKELLKTIGYALAMMLCIGLTGGGIKSGASVLLQDGFLADGGLVPSLPLREFTLPV